MSQIDSTGVTREHLRFALSHPLVQAELRRQQADLQELQLVSAETSLPGSVISDLRDRARRDAEFFLNAATAHWAQAGHHSIVVIAGLCSGDPRVVGRREKT